MNNKVYSWQTNQWERLNQLRKSQKLPHAMLFEGAEGLGKKSFARFFASSLLCKQPSADGAACGQCSSCQLISAGTHPDFVTITPTPPDKSQSKKPVLHIRIGVIRDLCSKLAATSQLEGYRIAIIEDADRMVIAAANALLKTLEEPGDDTLIMLVTSKPHRLPITIRSRCQAVTFAEPGRSEALNWLSALGIQKPDVALNLAHGAPLLAASYEEDLLQERELLSKALLAGNRGESALSYARKLADLPKDKGFAWLLDWAGDLVRIKQCSADTALVNEDYRDSLQKVAEKADTRRIFDYYDLVCSHIRQDGIALNSQLLWENLLISWDNL